MRGNIIQKIVVVILMFFPSVVFANKPPDDAQKSEIINQTYRIQIPFIENKGQLENKYVKYYAKTFRGTIFVGKDGTLTYSLPFEEKGGIVIKEVFADKRISVTGLDFSPTRVNYFKGKDKSEWRSNIPSYERVSLGEVCDGTELKLKVYGNNVEKLFTVLPGKNPEQIKVALQGAKELKVSERGELEVVTKLGYVKFTKPLAFQRTGDKKQPIEVAYVIHENDSYGFKVDKYDKNKPLTIDPLLASTFIGGRAWEYGYSITLDKSGNVFITGKTKSYDFPMTPDSYDDDWKYNYDVFISKFDSNLTTLLASTFLGSGAEYNQDAGYCIAVDASGNVFVTGEASGQSFPTTPGAYDVSYGGYSDCFISKLDNNLSSLLASTFLGGSSSEDGKSIVIDAIGNVYVTGNTNSSDFPTTPNAYDVTKSSPLSLSRDVFVSKLDNSLSSLLASTFIGGDFYDWGKSIVLDNNGNVYVAGTTISIDFPTTPEAYDTDCGTDGYCDTRDREHPTVDPYGDAFVSKIDSDLTTLLASTFLGGEDDDNSSVIALDGKGDVYLIGEAKSTDFPTTPGAYNESFNGGEQDVFVSKLSSELNSLLASTFIGGNSFDYGYSIILDKSTNVYITGSTLSDNYPTTPGAYNESGGGVFISKFSNGLNSLLASTFTGGGHAHSIALDNSENIYIIGSTTYGDYPTTPDAFEQTKKYGYDVFVSKLDGNLSGGDVTTTSTTTESSTTTTASTESTTSTIDSDDCPISSALEGDKSQLDIIRTFRDNVLSQTPEGQELIRLYYEWSPAIVKVMEEDKESKGGVKKMIDGILELIVGEQ